jgi:hypothetical protein
MIKKELKTLSQLRTPKQRWRIHVNDGSFIDVEGEEERNRTVIQLLRQGRITPEMVDGINTIRTRPINAETITLNLNIHRTNNDVGGELRTLEEPKKTLWKSFKEDLSGWSWPNFKYNLLVSTIISLVSYLGFYFSEGPIKLSNTFTTGLLAWFGMTSTIISVPWVLTKLWKILPYITCWLKFSFFLLMFIFTMLTVGLINEGVSDKIMNFMGKYTMSNREIRILKIVLP